MYDKEREDGYFTPQEPTAPQPLAGIETTLDGDSANPESSGEWNPLDSIFVTMPPWHPVIVGSAGLTGGKGEKEKTAKNPVSHWKVSKKSIIGKAYPFVVFLSVNLTLLQILSFLLMQSMLLPFLRMAA